MIVKNTPNKPQTTQKKFNCEKCDFHSNNKKDYKKHLQTNKHNDIDIDNTSYKCICGKVYKYSSGLYRHKKTCNYENMTPLGKMDKKWINMDKNGINMDKNWQKNNTINNAKFNCECGKSYKFQSGLSKHKKKCQFHNQNTTNYANNIDNNHLELITEMIKNNKELVDKIIDVLAEPKNNHSNNNNNNNSNNVTFNLHNFLTIDCKDAMNMSDFIDQIKFNVEDLNTMAESGFLKVLENKFLIPLKQMEQTKRPIHCSDKKRKSMYVKDDDEWKKDKNHKLCKETFDKLRHKQRENFLRNQKYNETKDKHYYDNDKNEMLMLMTMKNLLNCNNDKTKNKLVHNLCNSVEIDKTYYD